MRQILALLAFSVGVFAPNFFRELPSFFDVALICAAMVCLFYRVRQFWAISFALGFLYGSLSAIQFSHSILPPELNNQPLFISGRIEGIPNKTARAWQIDLIADDIGGAARLTESGSDPSSQQFSNYRPKKLRLSYYGFIEQPFQSGEWLQLEVKLKRPHGFMNPRLFDYQRWLIGKGYSATGYIKQIHQRSNAASHLGLTVGAIDRWRDRIARDIADSGVRYSGVQAALLVGDRRNMQSDLMPLFVDTGTVHLMVISGLHIGFVAAIGYFLGRWLFSFLSPFTGLNAIRCGTLCAVFAAIAYAAAAGFSTSTLRAVAMLMALLLPRVFYLKANSWWCLCVALAVVAFMEPRAPLDNGFWLSFCAVLLIFFNMGSQFSGNGFELGDQPAPPKQTAGPCVDKKLEKKLGRNMDVKIDGKTGTGKSALVSLVRIQLVFLIGFSTMILMIQGQLNLVSFPANLIAVPLTGLLIVPLEILGLVLYQIVPAWGVAIWHLVGQIIHLEVGFLHGLSELIEFRFVRSSVPDALALVAVLAGLAVFGLKKLWQKALALLLMLPLFWPFPMENYPLEIRFFDVGQGTALLVRQPDYSLLYDTGPKYSDNFDSGAHILAPSLAQLRINNLDDLIISHPDADHIGGFEGLSKKISATNIWVGRQPEQGEIAAALPCSQGIQWRQGAISYEFIHPHEFDPGVDAQTDNDRSCVLKMSWGNQIILLAGDISSSIEKRLQLDLSGDQSVVLLLAPHHGSKNSSSMDFVSATRPDYVVFSAGYLNQFGHPHSDVVERYAEVGAKSYSTAEQGMIRFRWKGLDETPVAITEAEQQSFWWQK